MSRASSARHTCCLAVARVAWSAIFFLMAWAIAAPAVVVAAAQQQAPVVTKVVEAAKATSRTLRCAPGAPPGSFDRAADSAYREYIWNTYGTPAPNKDPSASGCFTVRPRETATATRTEQAGEFALDSLDDYLAYVPQQCVGPRRCPLLVFLHGAGFTASLVMRWPRPVADKYGMILLVPSSPTKQWDTEHEEENRTNVDAALKQVLRRFAVDPDKIALLGRCAGGPTALIWGGDNLDVFSRILAVSGGYPTTVGVDATNKSTEIFLDAGFLESAGNFRAARELRQAGHPVKHVLTLRDHSENAEDYDFIGRWLQASWATPNPAARPAPTVLAGPVPLLTAEMVSQLTAFWTSFLQEPDSIRTAARRAHQREVTIAIGDERPSVVMTDMPALAAQYPSVAAALNKAGLTAEQHEAYRAALVSALVADNVAKNAEAEHWRGPVVDATSTLAKNIEFLNAHADELAALEQTGIWQAP